MSRALAYPALSLDTQVRDGGRGLYAHPGSVAAIVHSVGSQATDVLACVVGLSRRQGMKNNIMFNVLEHQFCRGRAERRV